ncbi:unnamed protein product [Closterium sp. Naga37s-1]|nr:unnamed protein product [Closterium sp. Naga37s-1]
MFSNPTTTGAARDPNPDAQLQVGTRVSINGHAITFSSLRCVDIPAKSARGRQKVQVAWTRPHDDADCSKIQFFSKPGAKTIAKAAKSVRCIIEDICRHAVCPTNFSCAATTDRRGVACVCEGDTQSTDGSCTVDEEYYTAPEPAPSPTDTVGGPCITGATSETPQCNDRIVSSPHHPYQPMCVATALATPASQAPASAVAPAPTPVSARPCMSQTPEPTDTPPVNTGVDCSAALTRGQTLNVTERDDLASCSVFYFIQPGDTCESVAASLGLSSSSLPLLNPGSVCSSPLNPSRSLCIERDDGKVGTGEQRCNSLYSLSECWPGGSLARDMHKGDAT